MGLENLRLDTIREEHLQRLVDERVYEGKAIDYKKDTSADAGWRVEFRKDVTSFANADGGDIVIGVRDLKGEPKELCGTQHMQPEGVSGQLTEIVGTGIKPRIPGGIRVHPVPLAGRGLAFVVRVGKSYAAPHQVEAGNQDFQFWTRHSSGKQRMDVDELRASFLVTQTAVERIRAFRDARSSAMQEGKFPVLVYGGAWIVVHLVPLNAFGAGVSYPLVGLESHMDWLPPMCQVGAIGYRWNLDGFMVYAPPASGTNHSLGYTLLYRNGIIEAVDSAPLHIAEDQISPVFEKSIRQSVARYLQTLSDLGIRPPVILLVSFLGVRGFTMAVPSGIGRFQSHPIDRRVLVLPEAVIEDFSEKLDPKLRPIYDAVWNAADYPRSPSFDTEGNWRPG